MIFLLNRPDRTHEASLSFSWRVSQIDGKINMCVCTVFNWVYLSSTLNSFSSPIVFFWHVPTSPEGCDVANSAKLGSEIKTSVSENFNAFPSNPADTDENLCSAGTFLVPVWSFSPLTPPIVLFKVWSHPNVFLSVCVSDLFFMLLLISFSPSLTHRFEVTVLCDWMLYRINDCSTLNLWITIIRHHNHQKLSACS